MVINNRIINNIPRISDTQPGKTVQKTPQEKGDFGSILQEKLGQSNGIKFSKHAELRLQSRNISVTKEQIDKIGSAVSRAEGKGVRDSLVIMDNMAFVVNVKNRTVITAINSSELKDNVFTNIDGAVFA